MPYSEAAQGLLVPDAVILNHGQVMRTTLELAPAYPNHTLDVFNVYRPPSARWVFCGTRLKLMSRRPRVCYLDHQAIAATREEGILYE
ncbi:hypothetical protein TNCV_4293791 [Trichonephila clavipes]|uniref:Uncharacterized protein n=1 Tax=Trichonephila clavipes TaxID=2585209 RepID=A0A8X6V5X5_TRICX|nr:hypothetical protein TNCV_4293791 [Trichonephila clavipes]